MFYRVTYGPFTTPIDSRYSFTGKNGGGIGTQVTASDQSILADDRITQIGVKTQFRVHTYLFGSSVADLESQIESLSCALQSPRQVFRVEWSDKSDFSDDPAKHTLYAVGPGDYTFTTPPANESWVQDIAYGPIPSQVNIERFYGGLTAIYSFTITAFTKECVCEHTNTLPVLAFVRRYNYAINQNGLTTRTVSGKLITRPQQGKPQIGGPVNNPVITGFDNSGITADSYREMIRKAIPVPKNFKQEDYTFTISEDGREITYSIVDEERVHNLAAPMTDGQVWYEAKVSKFGARVDYNISGFMEAPRTIKKSVIYDAIAGSVIGLLDKAGSVKLIFESKSIKVSVLHPNRIEFNIGYWSAGRSKDKAKTPKEAILNKVGLGPALADASDSTAQAVTPYGGIGGAESGVITPTPVIWSACDASGDGSHNAPIQTQGSKDTTFTPSVSINAPATTLDTSSVPAADTQPRAAGVVNNNTGSPVPQQNPEAGSLLQQAVNTLVNVFNFVADQIAQFFLDIYTGLSNIGQNTPIMNYRQVICYQIDNGIRILAPKVEGLAPIAQQVHVPTMRIIQSGYFQIVATSPAELPGPTAPVVNAIIEEPSWEISSGEPIGDGTFSLYTAHWRYVMSIAGSPVSAALDGGVIQWSWDMRDPRYNDIGRGVSSIINFLTGVSLAEFLLTGQTPTDAGVKPPGAGGIFGLGGQGDFTGWKDMLVE